MKKILSIALVVAIVALLSGCAFFQTVKSALCPPSQEMVDQAAAAAVFLGGLTGKDYTTQIGIAKQIFLIIASRGCVIADQLTAAIDDFDQAVTATQVTTLMAGTSTKAMAVPNISALRAAVKGK